MNGEKTNKNKTCIMFQGLKMPCPNNQKQRNTNVKECLMH